MSTVSSWTDAEILQVLEDQAAGISATVTARAVGVTRSAVLGIRKRVRDETDACFGPHCRHDGTEEPGWWRAGLARRGPA